MSAYFIQIIYAFKSETFHIEKGNKFEQNFSHEKHLIHRFVKRTSFDLQMLY